MLSPKYTFKFSDINAITPVNVWDHHSGAHGFLHVSLDDTQLNNVFVHPIPPHIVDLVDLGIAIFTADRVAHRHNDVIYRIEIVLPVRCPDVLSREEFRDQLSDLLYWYTGDDWSFDFESRKSAGREMELQRRLLKDAASSFPDAVALWSGGLDSLAGLYARLVSSINTCFFLFGLVNNPLIRGTQRQIADELNSYFPGRVRLSQIVVRTSADGRFTANRRPRSRGVVFLLLGAAFAYLQGQRILNVFENGIGALNLPFRRSEVGLDHARSVHPQSLLYASNLVSYLINERFSVSNPFLFYTKGQLCQELARSRLADLAFRTVSCDSRHRQKDCPAQCGYCSSCLLRRQALSIYGDDKTLYVVPNDRISRTGEDTHLLAMLSQVDRLCTIFASVDWWQRLVTEYPTLVETVECIAHCERTSVEAVKQKLHDLYNRYTHEWSIVRPIVGRGLLDGTVSYISENVEGDRREETDLWSTISFNL